MSGDRSISVVLATEEPSESFERLLRSLKRVTGIEQAELLVGLFGPDGQAATTRVLTRHLPKTPATVRSFPNMTAATAAAGVAEHAEGELVLFLADGVEDVPEDLLLRAATSLRNGSAGPSAHLHDGVVVVRRGAQPLVLPPRSRAEPEPAARPQPRETPSELAAYSTLRVRLLLVANVVAAGFYVSWWLSPGHVGTPALFAALAAAEAFSLFHVVGLWWTVWFTRFDAPPAARTARSIDVFVTTCGEPLEILEPTVRAAVALRGGHETFVLDDAARPEVAELAELYGATYVTRNGRKGAKAGNLNHALGRTSGELVCTFDADHVPQLDFLERLAGYFDDSDVAFVQTPQFYVNARRDRVARGAYQQQALFYGPICRGKNGLNSAFCCGTNVVFRRAALEDVGGFDEKSVVEDFTTSIRIHRRGWRSIYYPYVLAQGLGPSDLRSYFRQQFRWARGSVGALATGEPFRRGLSLAQRVQYMLATTFYLTGVFTPVYVLLPILYLAGGWSAFSAGSGKFVFFYIPYLVLGLVTVRVGLGGRLRLEHLRYTFGAFPVYAVASVAALLHLPARFSVTGRSTARRFPPLSAVSLVAFGATALAVPVGLLVRPLDPATFTNVSWAVVNLLLLSGIAGAALRELGVFGRVTNLVPAQHPAPTTTQPGRLELPERALPTLRLRQLVRVVADQPSAVYVAGLTVVAFMLRMGLIQVQSIRLDESLSLTEARLPLSTMVHNLSSWDIHPPLYYTLLHAWVWITGSGAIALRLPSVLLGTACIPMLYLVGRRIVGPQAAVLAAALGAASPFWIWHSDEARMYPLFLFTSLLALWALQEARAHGGALRWSAYGALLGVSLYSHYFAVLMIPVHLAYLLSQRTPRRMYGRWAAGATLAIASFLPWIVFLWVERGGLGGIGTLETGLVAPAQTYSLVGTSYSIFLFLLVYIIGYGQSLAGGAGVLGIVARVLAGSWPLAAALVGLGRDTGRALRSPRVIFLFAWLGLTLGTVFCLNIWKQNLWLQRYLIIASPALFLLLALGLARLAGRRTLLAVSLVVATFAAATFVDNFDPSNQAREDWRGASEQITRHMRPGDAVVVMPWFYTTPLNYYFHERLPVRGLLSAGHGPGRTLGYDIPRIAARHRGSALWVVIAFENVFDPGGRIRSGLDRRYRLTADYRLGGEMELRRYVIPRSAAATP